MIGIVIENDFEIPQYIIVSFENNNVNTKTTDASIFNEMDKTECFCKIGSVAYPDNRLTNNYGTTLNYGLTLNLLKVLLILYVMH